MIHRFFLFRSLLVALIISGAFWELGCGSGASNGSNPGGGSPPSSVTFSGKVFAGTKAVAGASVQMVALSKAGYSAAASSLLSAAVVTDTSGSFTIPVNGYTCASSDTQIVFIAQGGNPGLPGTVNNAGLAMMTAWGNCGDLATSTSIYMNDVTTAATAWVLSPFLKSTTLAGTSSTNAAGLANAIASAKQLANIATGAAPGPSLPSNVTIETTKIYSLANILATCTQTAGGGSPCTTLFTLAPGAASSVPTNTADAAINIVKNPGRNVTALYALTGSTTPYAGRSSAPNDWTITVVSTNSGITIPTGVAIDSRNRVWTGNYSGGVYAFSPLGDADLSFTNTNLSSVLGLTVDPSDNVWATSGGDAVFKFTRDGTNLSGTTGFKSSISHPIAIAADSRGNAWVANNGNSSVVLLSSSGAAQSQSTVLFADALAVDSSNGVWASGSDRLVKYISSAGVASPDISCCQGPSGLALDRNSNLWISDYNAKAVVRLNTSTSAVAGQTTLAGGLYYPQGIAVDGAGDVWVANYLSNSITELAGATNTSVVGTALSPSTGFGSDVGLSLPFAVAVDASGNVWVSSSGDGRLVRFVGLATPAKTPLTGPAQLP